MRSHKNDQPLLAKAMYFPNFKEIDKLKRVYIITKKFIKKRKKKKKKTLLMHRLLKAKQCKEGRRKETEKNWRKGFDGNEILFITIILLQAPIYITITNPSHLK